MTQRRAVTPPTERREDAALAWAWIVARAHAKGLLIDPPPEVTAQIQAFNEARERISGQRETPA